MAVKGRCGVIIVLLNGAQVQLTSTLTKDEIINAREGANKMGGVLRIPTANVTEGQQNEEIFVDPKNIAFMSLVELIETLIQKPQMALQTSFGKGPNNGRVN